MEISQENLNLWDGRLLTAQEKSKYEKWALDFFQDKRYVEDPWLNLTLKVDISAARNNYKKKYCEHDGATFTAWLTWKMIQAMKTNPWTRYRRIAGQWYIFENLPLFFPVAIDDDARFTEPLITNPISSWHEFTLKWQRATKTDQRIKIPHSVWSLAHFIGNLPNINFTSFNLHRGSQDSSRPFFYFGKRHEVGGKWFVPLSITFNHSTGDPVVIDKLLADFTNLMMD